MKPEWIKHKDPTYQSIAVAECEITLEPRPHYCDRGNFLAKIFPSDGYKEYVDAQDLWPRYYFDEERAKLEIEAWLEKRGLI